jgi:CDP-glucose 4,6-dehydratase
VSGQPLEVRSPGAVRPWQHVLNPLSGYLQLAERLCAEDGEMVATAFNFGPTDAEARPVSWMVERLRERWPGEVDVRLGSGDAKEAGTLRVDSSRAREKLGWAPGWRLETGLDATIAWYARQAAGEDARALTFTQIADFEGVDFA